MASPTTDQQQKSSTTSSANSFDLFGRMSSFMDPHLMFPLFNYLKQVNQETKTYKEKDLIAAELNVAGATKMVDYEKDLYTAVHGKAAPAEMDTKAQQTLERCGALETQLEALINLIVNKPDEVQAMRDADQYTLSNGASYQGLTATYNITSAHVELLFEYSKLTYETGDYENALLYLSHYLLLGPEGSETLHRALWGKLAAEILFAITCNEHAETDADRARVQETFAQAAADLNILSTQIDNNDTFSQLMQLSMRGWLLHWSLFVYFQQAEGGRDALVEMFFQDKNMNCIQTHCPWLLRYLAFAVVTDKRRWRGRQKDDLLKTIQLEAYEYTDPITEFMVSLFAESNFDAAQQKLMECTAVLKMDYFLSPLSTEFMEMAKECVFEMKCRIHQKIDMNQLAKSLNLQQAEAERWIIGLINDSKLDAKIDSASNHVEMEKTYPSIYSQIVSKTKHLTYQTHALHDQVRDYYGECKATAVAAAEERAQKAAALAAEQKRQADAKQEVCCVWCVGVFFEQWNQKSDSVFFSLIFIFFTRRNPNSKT
jgi:translation initiation factor 3 subunit E